MRGHKANARVFGWYKGGRGDCVGEVWQRNPRVVVGRLSFSWEAMVLVELMVTTLVVDVHGGTLRWMGTGDIEFWRALRTDPLLVLGI